MYGFKSFADKTELALSPGITAIVGPNGSGKSNIADAIRWALGEQSAKTLRGSKMEDVIFSGTNTRKPLGFAEVTLVFDNSDGFLSVDFLEVQVTRRVYRSGASEFLISGVPCRLKDIHTLFMDTGLGRSGYSVIEQGRIDSILAAGSDQRRAFFEEASGIHRYKVRRNETERRLEAVGKNRERIQDLVLELGRQLEPLAKRADEAKQFKSYSHELSTLEIGFILSELEKLNETKDDLMKKLSHTGIQLRQLREEQDTLDSEIMRDKAHLTQLEEVRDETHSRVTELGAEIEKIEGKVGITSERLASFEKELVSLEASGEKDKTGLTHLQQELEIKRARLVKINAEIEAAREYLEDRESEEEGFFRTLGEKREAEEGLKIDVIEVLSKLAEVKNELSRKKMDEESEERQVQREREQLEQALQELDDISNKLDHDTGYLEELSARKDSLSREILKAEQDLRRSADELEKLTESRRSLERQAHEKSLELEACRRQVMKGQWYPEGTRAVITAARRNALEGVIGTLADIIRVPSKYEYAIESALGRSLLNIVVEKERHAKSAVAYLKERKLGRATFLPLDLIRPGGFPARHLHILDMPGIHGIASQLVSHDDPVKKAVEFSLGRILVVDNLDVAVKATVALDRSLKIVTIDGDIIFPGGAISGGSRRARPGRRLLEVKRRLNDLERDERSLRDDESRVVQQVESAKRVIRDLEKLSENLNSQCRAIELESVKRQALQAERCRELDKAHLRVDMLRSQLESRAQRGISSDDIRQKLEDRYEELTAASRELSTIQAELSKELKELSSARDDAMHDITATKVKIASRSQEAENLKQSILTLEASGEELASRVYAIGVEIIRVKNLISETRQGFDTDKACLDMLRKKRLELEKTFASVRDHRRATVRSISDKEENMKALQMRIGGLEKDETTSRLRRVEVMEGIRHRVDDLERGYRMTPEEAKLQLDPARYENIRHRDNAKEEIRLLRDKMDTIGPVDLGVIEIYESMKSRQGYLEEGLKDHDNAVDFLGRMIERYDKESERRFRETFDAVRLEFNKLFSRLFGGGSADLILVDLEGLRLPGVEIVAQPPGKRLQNLTLLSAGERALSAIALVFAILKIHPSPCCILDEIDAALDEANVGRFADLMCDAAEEGQFIVVTHRKGTMETAGTLYGVTMEESGISKLVSLNLENTKYPRQETA